MMTDEEKRKILGLDNEQWQRFKNCYGNLTTKILDRLLSLKKAQSYLHTLELSRSEKMNQEQIIHLQKMNDELTKMLGKIVIFGTFYPSAIELDHGVDGEALGKEAREVLHRALDD